MMILNEILYNPATSTYLSVAFIVLKSPHTQHMLLGSSSSQAKCPILASLADFTATEMPPIGLCDLPFFTDRTLTIFAPREDPG
jgi:hypothetical protein